MLNRLFILIALFGLMGSLGEAKNRKAEKAAKEAYKAELSKDWDKALALYEEAYRLEPEDTGRMLSVRRVRFQAGMQHVERGQKLRKEGKLEEALNEFQRGFAIDPSLGLAEQEVRRTYEMIQREKKGEESGQPAKPEDRGLSDAQRARKEMETRTSQVLSLPELKPLARTISNLKMNNQPVKVLYETVCKLAGINVLFDPDFLQGLQGRNYPIELNNVTIEEALEYLSLLTKAYYKPISANAIFVTKDDVGKRREYEDQVVKTFYLQ
ncbi:MAG: STN domain-containing protein, partial [Bryobacter sp.]|nr:STN domain-containing protein [Bryobacter sp.]